MQLLTHVDGPHLCTNWGVHASTHTTHAAFYAPTRMSVVNITVFPRVDIH